MKLPDEQEQQIQDEIRKRILEISQKKQCQQEHSEETQATLDALEEIVDMPREEMERIAKAVEKEFQQTNPPPRSSNWHFSSILILAASTFFLFRRGSPFYLIAGAILILVLYLKWRK